MARVLVAAAAAGGRAEAESAIARELAAFTGASSAALLRVDDGAPEVVADALTAELAIRLEGDQARRVTAAMGSGPESPALLLPLRTRDHRYVLALAGEAVGDMRVEHIEAAAALLGAAGTSLEQVRRADAGDRYAAIARAARALNESLDLAHVLPRICEEAAAILGAAAVAVYRSSGARGFVLEAAYPGADSVDAAPDPAAGGGTLTAPLHWDGETRGVLWVRFEDPSRASEERGLLESFAELAAVACRNASVHAGLAEAARTDALTGCLNHAALHETLRREMQRSRRTGRRLSIVLVDLDHFKQVNERHGHLMGDEVLRRVGRGLREAVRPYDFVARYGGDEFAIVAVDAHEGRAAEIAERAVARLGRALADVLEPAPGSFATAGVAEWNGQLAPSDLVRDADRALLYGKQQGIRGGAVLASDVPDGFALGRPFGEDELPPEPSAGPSWPSAVREETEPLRKRARRLTLANAFGARVAALTHVDDVVAAAIDELQRAFGYSASFVVRLAADGSLSAGRPWSELRASDAVERSLVERRPVKVDEIARRSAYLARSGEVGSEVAIPILVDDRLWGALDIQEEAARAFEDADVRLLEAVADQLASALAAAVQFERLERAYLATAEALGAALESKDAHTAEHARSLVRNAEKVGRRLGMSDGELRDLRFAAAFHDIGKVAVPERILNKPGPLTEVERREVERHVEAGAEILAEVDFLEGALPLLRHSHEHWDGGGYPDGLAGDRIPLGARVILVCDAHDAMTADRPYRRALPPDAARDEIRSAAGRQFDSRVASAFLDAVGKRAAPGL
jgi:diguanylate cyclase (GGDEF)-like protein